MNTYYDTMPSPIGRLLLTSTEKALSGVFMEDHKGGPEPRPDWLHDPARLRSAVEQMRSYFEGSLREFELELDMQGTAFQMEVWKALRRVPFGATASYRDLAKDVGRPNAVRAVGSANGRNPVSIVVPCHRVIGADGSLTGYGGGLDRKRFLLDHEARVTEAGRPRRTNSSTGC